MRSLILSCALFIGAGPYAVAIASPEIVISEVVYVETSSDTDLDGRLDRIYATVTRPQNQANLPTIFTISPYSTGGNGNVPNHSVDTTRLPQDGTLLEWLFDGAFKARFTLDGSQQITSEDITDHGYASVSAHSLGTGLSTGCPTVGDQAETLAAKAVIDWLNGRARAYSSAGREVFATWANGFVGMTGVSYNGTLPNMVATTGVEGLKAIVPISAISNWYDYYRANGLVVGPGGYVGEDADVLGKFVVRSGSCAAAIRSLSQTMGREHGDFSRFWQERDYVSQATNVRAAVFIIHGQSDWNVKQLHAIQWWEALAGRVPLRMWLHRGGHGNSSRADESAQIWAWFDRYVKGEPNGVESQPAVEIESPSQQWTSQASWPSEQTSQHRFYLNPEHELGETPREGGAVTLVDNGKSMRLETMLNNPTGQSMARLAFISSPFSGSRLMSGTPKVQLNIAVLNRHAANLTVAIVEYDANGRGRIVTRGWADPQNYADLTQGESLDFGRFYHVTFNLEPKQYTFAPGSRLGVVIASTDYEYTMRPDNGTQIAVAVGAGNWVDLNLSDN